MSVEVRDCASALGSGLGRRAVASRWRAGLPGAGPRLGSAWVLGWSLAEKKQEKSETRASLGLAMAYTCRHTCPAHVPARGT